MPATLNANIVLKGYLNDFALNTFETDALNFVYEQLDKGTLTPTGEVRIGSQTVYHYTHHNKAINQTCSIFFLCNHHPTHLYLYAIGRNIGNSNQDFRLITYIDKKETRYTLNHHHKDNRFKYM